jgi:hypothetical protein
MCIERVICDAETEYSYLIENNVNFQRVNEIFFFRFEYIEGLLNEFTNTLQLFHIRQNLIIIGLFHDLQVLLDTKFIIMLVHRHLLRWPSTFV